MWFFVRFSSLMIDMSANTDFAAVDVSGEERWYLPHTAMMDTGREFNVKTGAVLLGWKHPWDH